MTVYLSDEETKELLRDILELLVSDSKNPKLVSDVLYAIEKKDKNLAYTIVSEMVTSEYGDASYGERWLGYTPIRGTREAVYATIDHYGNRDVGVDVMRELRRMGLNLDRGIEGY